MSVVHHQLKILDPKLEILDPNVELEIEDPNLETEDPSPKIRKSNPVKHNPNITKHVGTFLNNTDFAHYAVTAHYFHNLFQKKLLEREQQQLAQLAEILDHIFNADPKKAAEFFEKSRENKKLTLKKSFFHEGYFSKILNQFVCFRFWKKISPLQAAAACGDIFLVCTLLSYLEGTAEIRSAAKQLQDVLEGSPLAPAEFLAPLKNLLDADGHYNMHRPKLLEQQKWEELDKLRGFICECHRRLPRYVLQEIFDEHFNPTLDFVIEPNRGELKCYKFDQFVTHSLLERLLDLDEIGELTLCGLFPTRQQDTGIVVLLAPEAPAFSRTYLHGGKRGIVIPMFINQLLENRTIQLKAIIEHLLTTNSTQFITPETMLSKNKPKP